MKRLLIAAAILVAASAPAFAQTAPANPPAAQQASSDEQALRDLDRRLMEAALKGDRKFLEETFADSMIFTNSDGKLTSREEALKDYRPPPPDLKINLSREDMRVHLYGDAAVVSGRTVGTVEVGGQTVKVNERTTDTYVRREGRWRLVAGHTSNLPPERAAAKIEQKLLDAYAGEYQFTPSLVFVVTNEGGKLMGQGMNQGKPAGPKVELLPKDEATFFVKDSTEEIVFVRGADGKVTHALSRSNGQEVKAAKVK